MLKSMVISYIGCKVTSRGEEKIVYIDSYFIRRVSPINVSLLIYPYSLIKNHIIESPSSEDIVLEEREECHNLLEYIVNVYRDLKSEGLRLFKRMHWYNVSNLLIPVRFSPTTREKMNQYERLVGELMASAMLLDRFLGKNVLRGRYTVENNGLKYVRLRVSESDNGIVFLDGFLGKVYTRLYETDERFRVEVEKILDLHDLK